MAVPMACVPVAHALTTPKLGPFALSSMATTPLAVLEMSAGMRKGDTWWQQQWWRREHTQPQQWRQQLREQQRRGHGAAAQGEDTCSVTGAVHSTVHDIAHRVRAYNARLCRK
jgi:hypothetical protein